jgi:ABC-type bacteriocin/lantibiotic exporter with double-glycine peptidase domain
MAAGSFAFRPASADAFKRARDDRLANHTTVKLNAAYFHAAEFVSAIASVGILLYGGHQVLQGDVMVGVLVGFIAALKGFFDPISQLSQVYTTYQSRMAALDKISTARRAV